MTLTLKVDGYAEIKRMLSAAFAYARIQKHRMIDEMGSILPEGFELKLLAPKLKMGDLKPVTSQYSQQMQTIFGAQRLYGWAVNNSAYLQEYIADTVSIIENYTTALTAKGWSFSAALEHVHAMIAGVMTRFDQQVSKFMADSIVAAAEAIGADYRRRFGIRKADESDPDAVRVLSDLKNSGAQLIELGVMIFAFKSALKSVLANPRAAIAIVVAIVAAASAMTALINKNAEKSVLALANGGLAYGPTYAMVGDNPNAGIDSEVIAPLSKLQAMLPTGGSIVELVFLENRTLVVKLEEGEGGTLRENDLYMGIFLNFAMDASSGNTVDSDDSFGNRTYAGFTLLLSPYECLDRDTYAEWRYELREGYPYHLQAAMQFVAFGNTTDVDR